MLEILVRLTLRMLFVMIVAQHQLAVHFGLVIQGLIILAIIYLI